MAFFKYLGEPARPYVEEYGPTDTIKVPKKDGTSTVLTAPTGAGWPVGGTLPFDFTDERSLRVMRADSRYEEI